MDRNFQILTDSTCDLPESWLAERPYITVLDVPVIVTKGDERYELNNLRPTDFYQAEKYVERGFRTTTSQPLMYMPDMECLNIPEEGRIISTEEAVRRNVAKGKDVIYIVMNSSLSSAYGYATKLFAKLQAELKASGRKTLCVDSQCMSTGLAMLMMDVAKGVEDGTLQDVQQIAEFVKKTRGHIAHFFTWEELSYIRKSGRVKSSEAFIGSILGFRLVCSAQYRGEERDLLHVTPSHTATIKVRGIGRWADVVGMYMKRHITDTSGPVILAYSNNKESAKKIHNRLLSFLPNANYLMGEEWRCGAGIQAHGGPTSIHINFHTDVCGKYDETVKEIEDIVRSFRW